MFSEKYRNGRAVTRKRGRYAKPPTLSDMGFNVNQDASLKTCADCGDQCRPVLNTWVCSSCGHHNNGTEES